MQRTVTIGSQPQTELAALRNNSQPNLLTRAHDLLKLCARNWYWFLLSIGLCVAFAYYQIRSTPNEYYRSASIIIKDDRSAHSQAQSLRDLGLDMAPINVTNEIMALTSAEVMAEVVRILGLNVQYWHEAPFHNVVAYGHSLPVNLEFKGLPETSSGYCSLSLRPDTMAVISGLVIDGSQYPDITAKVGHEYTVGDVTLAVVPTAQYSTETVDRLIVRIMPVDAVARGLAGSVHAELRSRDATLVDISITDQSAERAEDILNTVVRVYNDKWIDEQNRISLSTNQMIHQRLGLIEGELSEVERDIAEYKSANLMPDVDGAGVNAVNKADGARSLADDINMHIYKVKYLKSYLNGGTNAEQLIPANTGIGNPSIEAHIDDYNKLMMKRKELLRVSSLQNPMIDDIDGRLGILQKAINQALDNELTLLTSHLAEVEGRYKEAVGMIAANPAQSTHLKSIERQQKVKEQLYLYLLQRREENVLSQTFTANNSRLIDPPHGPAGPVSPVPQQLYLLALAIGVLVPLIILSVRERYNTKVRGRKDIECLNIPIVGEVPLNRDGKRPFWRRKPKEKVHCPVVRDMNRDVMNEAFRVVRSNLEFILGFEPSHRVIMFTSLNPGSGKTFCTANLATSLGINSRHVVVVDLDMRKASLSRYVDSPTEGISAFLSGKISDWREIVKKMDSVDVIPCGKLPPNPTELLYSPNLQRLITELREQYEYVFLDCPPVEVVADASIINRYVDITVFIVRAHLLDRTFLPDIANWHDEGRYKNLSLMLNGTKDDCSRYGYHRYGR